MGSPKKVGIFFFYNENWIGGTYYILNLIEALKLLPTSEQPTLTIFYLDEPARQQVEQTGYPLLNFAPITYHNHFWKRSLRVAARKLFRRSVFKPSSKKRFPAGYFDALFPAPVFFERNMAKKSIYWIPDFQEARLPHFFSEQDIAGRKAMQRSIAASNDYVVFSSQDALRDFEQLYPGSGVKTRVMQFAVTHPRHDDLDFGKLREKYELPDVFFFCPNQFWVHKNQRVVLEAISKLQELHNKKITVVFSGKAYDPRNPDYFRGLEAFIADHHIGDSVRFLGFIDRKEQLRIMQQAEAVIQPSLFEGWSTVVEDAKAMDQYVIASDLPVHREQLGKQAVYFDPSNSDELMEILLRFRRTEVAFHYEQNRVNFARQFMEIVDV